MVSLLLIQLACGRQSLEQVQERLVNFTKKANTLSIDAKLTSAQVPGTGTAHLVFVRPNKARFEMKWNKVDYVFSGSDKGLLQVEHTTQAYEDQPTYKSLLGAESNVSQGPALFFPSFLFNGRFDQEAISEYKIKESQTINGIRTDQIEGVGLVAKVNLFIDSEGRPVRYIIQHASGPVVQADFSNLVLNKPQPDSLFGFNPPVGYKIFSIPMEERPLGADEKFPLSGWTSKSAPMNAGAKPLLVLVSAADCEPSARSAPALQKIQASGAAQVVVVSTSAKGEVPSALAKFPIYFDPSSKILDKLQIAGTPFIYLVKKDGMIGKTWYGFDPEKADAFEKDVQALAKKG